jgi:hypothetical protein
MFRCSSEKPPIRQEETLFSITTNLVKNAFIKVFNNLEVPWVFGVVKNCIAMLPHFPRDLKGGFDGP